MGRRYSSSFGLESAVADMEYHSNATAAPSIENWPGTGFVKSARITGLVSAQSKGFNISPASLDMMGIRFYFWVTTAPTAANTILRISGAAVFARLKLNNSKTLELSDEDGVIGTSASPVANGDFVEVLFDRSTSAGTHIVRLYINGTEVAGSGTRDISGTPNVLEFGGNRNLESQTQGDWYFTGIAVNDNTGSVQNGRPGPGFQVYAHPSANGDANVAATRGGTDTGADYSQLSEVTPDDAGTYIELTTTAGVVWVKVPSAATLGIGEAYIINLIQVGGRIALASAATGNWFPSIKSQAGGTALDGTPVSLASASYFTHDDTSGFKQYKLTSYTDPQTGGEWTAAKIDTMQIGAKTSDGTPATRISKLWAIIEYQVFEVNIPSVLPGGLYSGLWVPHGGLS